MPLPEAKPSQIPSKTEQDEWREERMDDTNAFRAALKTAEGMDPASEGSKTATLTRFIHSVFETSITAVEGERPTYRVEVQRPDGILRRAIISPSEYSGFYYDVRFSDVLPDGTEKNEVKETSISFYHLATGITY